MTIESHGQQSIRLVAATPAALAAALVAYTERLAAARWRYAPARAPSEHSRWWRRDGGAVLVIYHTGTVLAQGRDWRRALDDAQRIAAPNG